VIVLVLKRDGDEVSFGHFYIKKGVVVFDRGGDLG
jgi:hypothetical protein